MNFPEDSLDCITSYLYQWALLCFRATQGKTRLRSAQMSYGFFECLEGPFNCLPCTISQKLRKIIDFAQLGVLLRSVCAETL